MLHSLKLMLRVLRRGAGKVPQHVKGLKRRLLEKAFTNFSTHASDQRRSEFRAFCEEQSAWLPDYALFRVLMEASDIAPHGTDGSRNIRQSKKHADG